MLLLLLLLPPCPARRPARRPQSSPSCRRPRRSAATFASNSSDTLGHSQPRRTSLIGDHSSLAAFKSHPLELTWLPLCLFALTLWRAFFFPPGASRAICWSSFGPPRATARPTRATKRPWLSSRQVQTRRTDNVSDAWRCRDSCARPTSTGTHAALPPHPTLRPVALCPSSACSEQQQQLQTARKELGLEWSAVRTQWSHGWGRRVPARVRSCGHRHSAICCGVFSTSLGCSLCLSNVVCCPLAVDFH